MCLACASSWGGDCVHFDKRPDVRSHALYTSCGRKKLEREMLPLLRNPLLAGKFKSNIIPWLGLYWPGFVPCLSELSNGAWLPRFTDGDESFYRVPHCQQAYKCKWQFQLVFDLAQKHSVLSGGHALFDKRVPGVPFQLIQGRSPGQVYHLMLGVPRLD